MTTFKDRIITSEHFYAMKAPRDPQELFAKMGLPGECSTSFVDQLRDLEESEAQNNANPQD